MTHVEPRGPASALEALSSSERFVLRAVRAWACRRRLPAEPAASAFSDLGVLHRQPGPEAPAAGRVAFAPATSR